MNFSTLLQTFQSVLHADAAVAPAWLLTNTLLVIAAWKWARILLPADGLFEAVGHAVLLFWAGIVLIATTLGCVGGLSGLALLTGLAALAAIALTALKAAPAPAAVRMEREELSWLLLWGAIFAFACGHVITGGLLRFPTDWDSLAYHLPLVNHWMQTGSLYVPDCGRGTNPGNCELLSLWAVAPFSGDFFATLGNLPLAVLLACSVIGLGTRIGLARPFTHVAALAAVSNFVVVRQLTSAENDLAVAAAFFAVLHHLWRYLKAPNRSSLFLGAIGLGLLAGIKYYALGYALLAAAVWVCFTLVLHGPRPARSVFLGLAAGLLALGGYWYIRNVIMTGSPFYPREPFKQPDQITLMYPEFAYTSFLGNRRPELPGMFLTAVWKMTGPVQGAATLLVLLTFPALTGTAVWLIRSVKTRPDGWRRLAFAVVLVGTGLLLASTPFAVEDDPGTLNQLRWHYCPVRYGLCFLNTATLGMLLVAQDLLALDFKNDRALSFREYSAPRRAVAGLFAMALAGACFFQLVWVDPRAPFDKLNAAIIGVNIVLVALVLLLSAHTFYRSRRLVYAVAFGLSTIAAVPVSHYLSERWHNGFVRHYDRLFAGRLTQWIGEKNPGHESVCVVDHRYYPFFGSYRQYRVFQPVYVPSADRLLEILDEYDATVVIGHASRETGQWHRFRGLKECVERYPDRFENIFSGSEVIGFRFSRANRHD